MFIRTILEYCLLKTTVKLLYVNCALQQLSLVNADQLNAAIELAKRDIKRSEEIKIASPKSKENNRKKAKIVKSNDYKERLRRRQERTESENKVRVLLLFKIIKFTKDH